MNIFLVLPDNDSSMEKLETLFDNKEHKIFKIIIEGFTELSKDYFSVTPSLSSNEVFNLLVKQVSDQLEAIDVKPGLVFLHSGLNFSNLSNYIKKWQQCDLYLITE